ncbi:hypothetical protein DERF_015994 [Dermatophagoides farinae]|uniref:Uncharacterized protein n=1 Tax=Dermatophagoides farinae TaxID=6954 RepID=A0A922KYD8_DERFA|nr:hypothetical protein DERF_015994 [Dermatophagoides farinae]
MTDLYFGNNGPIFYAKDYKSFVLAFHSILFKKYFISIQGQLSNGNQVRVEFTKSNIFKNQLLIGFWFNNDITDFFRFNCFTTSCFKLNFLEFRINKIFIINCDSTASNLAVKVSSQTRSGPDVYLQDPYMTKLRIQFCSVRLFPIYLTRTSNGWYRDNFHMNYIGDHQPQDRNADFTVDSHILMFEPLYFTT